MSDCLLCGLANIKSEPQTQDVADITCGICGKYRLTHRGEDELRMGVTKFIKENLYLVSAISRHRTIQSLKPLWIDEQIVQRSYLEANIILLAPSTIEGKTDAILSYFASKSPNPGADININPEMDYPIGYCKSSKELWFYLNHLIETGLLKESRLSSMNNKLMIVTAQGWQYLQRLAKPNAESDQAFVAMWFDPSMTPAFKEGIEPLQTEIGFRMTRIDQGQFNDKICDKIIAEIRQSRFMIADVTGSRQAVYFEAGFAMGLNLPVIWTCREDEKDKMCFDTRQYNHIIWKTPPDLKEQLKERILATIGQFHKPKT